MRSECLYRPDPISVSESQTGLPSAPTLLMAHHTIDESKDNYCCSTDRQWHATGSLRGINLLHEQSPVQMVPIFSICAFLWEQRPNITNLLRHAEIIRCFHLHFNWAFTYEYTNVIINCKCKKCYPRNRQWQCIGMFPVRYQHQLHIERRAVPVTGRSVPLACFLWATNIIYI